MWNQVDDGTKSSSFPQFKRDKNRMMEEEDERERRERTEGKEKSQI